LGGCVFLCVRHAKCISDLGPFFRWSICCLPFGVCGGPLFCSSGVFIIRGWKNVRGVTWQPQTPPFLGASENSEKDFTSHHLPGIQLRYWRPAAAGGSGGAIRFRRRSRAPDCPFGYGSGVCWWKVWVRRCSVPKGFGVASSFSRATVHREGPVKLLDCGPPGQGHT